MKTKPVSEVITCEECSSEVDVMLYPSDPGQPDPNQSNPCPPEPAYHDPAECPECGHELLIEADADEMNRDAWEAAEDAKYDEWKESRCLGGGA